MAKTPDSNLSNDLQSVPLEYVLPLEKRPQNFLQTPGDNVPVIDLSNAGTENDRRNLVQQIIKAGQDFGIFHVINHGVSQELMEDTMKLYKEFFDMPNNEIDKYTMEAITPKNNELRNRLQRVKHPLNEIQSWPEKPARYGEVVAAYIRAILKLSSTILELISEGLGLEKGYLDRELRSSGGIMIANNYPPCPDPSVTIGLSSHGDVNLITILQQDVFGLQFVRDGRWHDVNVVPNSFVVNLACQLQVISNGRLRSPDHRVVTNLETSRTSVCTFISPNNECIIKPAEALLNHDFNPPLYKPYTYEEFLKHYLPNLGSTVETALEPSSFMSNFLNKITKKMLHHVPCSFFFSSFISLFSYLVIK